jgi:hypothetical protein
MRRASFCAEILRRAAVIGLTGVFTLQAVGCGQHAPGAPEPTTFDRQELATTCATIASSSMVLPSGATRSLFAVPQADGTALLSVTDTALDGTQATGYRSISPADLPSYTVSQRVDGTVYLGLADGTEIDFTVQYDPTSDTTEYDILDGNGNVQYSVSGTGFGPPSGNSVDSSSASSKAFPWLAVIIVVAIIVVVVAVNAEVRHCNDVSLPNLINQCKMGCLPNAMQAFTGYCSMTGAIQYGSGSGSGGGGGSGQIGCYCATGQPGPQVPAPGMQPVPAPNVDVLPGDLNQNLQIDPAGGCLPKVPAPPGAQLNR